MSVQVSVHWPDQRAVEVADGVIAVLHGNGEAGVANAGIVIDGTDALVVDTMMFPEMANGLRAEVDRLCAATLPGRGFRVRQRSTWELIDFPRDAGWPGWYERIIDRFRLISENPPQGISCNQL